LTDAGPAQPTPPAPPEDPISALLALANQHEQEGRLDEAEAMLAEAEDAFSQLSSGPHRAAAWVAQGDLAQRRGDDRRAAVLYRQAAEALQDFRF